MTPGTSRVTASIDDERRELPSREHVVADRHLLGRESLDHALVDPLVPPADEREVRLGRRAHARSAWSRRRPAGDRSSTRPRSGSSDSTAAKIGSGFMTMPGPPPNGLVVDRAGGGPSVQSRRSWTRTSSDTAGDRLAQQRVSRSGLSKIAGKIGDDVDPHDARLLRRLAHAPTLRRRCPAFRSPPWEGSVQYVVLAALIVAGRRDRARRRPPAPTAPGPADRHMALASHVGARRPVDADSGDSRPALEDAGSGRARDSRSRASGQPRRRSWTPSVPPEARDGRRDQDVPPAMGRGLRDGRDPRITPPTSSSSPGRPSSRGRWTGLATVGELIVEHLQEGGDLDPSAVLGLVETLRTRRTARSARRSIVTAAVADRLDPSSPGRQEAPAVREGPDDRLGRRGALRHAGATAAGFGYAFAPRRVRAAARSWRREDFVAFVATVVSHRFELGSEPAAGRGRDPDRARVRRSPSSTSWRTRWC